MLIASYFQMRVEGLSTNKTSHFSVILEVSWLPSTSRMVFLKHLQLLICALITNQVFQVAPTFFMVDIQKAAGDASEYLKVSCSFFVVPKCVSMPKQDVSYKNCFHIFVA